MANLSGCVTVFLTHIGLLSHLPQVAYRPAVHLTATQMTSPLGSPRILLSLVDHEHRSLPEVREPF